MLNALLELHEIRPAMIAERDRGEDDLATADLAEAAARAVARDVPGRLQPLRSGAARARRQPSDGRGSCRARVVSVERGGRRLIGKKQEEEVASDKVPNR